MGVHEACRVLGIEPTAWPVSCSALRTCYKQCVLATHPDKKGGSSEDFTRVRRAYEVLHVLCEAPHSSGSDASNPASDLLCKAFAGLDVEAELLARGVYRPPADFGCPPFTAVWGQHSATPARRYQYASSSDDEA